MIALSSLLVLCLLSYLLVAHPPLVLCLTLIALSATLSAIYGTLFSKWMCYAIVLVFLGGMMIVFLYVSSVTLNDKILTPKLSLALAPLAFLLLGPVLFHLLNMAPALAAFSSLTSSIFQVSSMALILYQVAYLLLALFTVVSLSQSFKGALNKAW